VNEQQRKENDMKRMTNIIYSAAACFALLQAVQAVVPPPDGGYPGGNTAEGQAALLSLTTGEFNTAVGYLSLRSNTEGMLNTAVGAGALLANVGADNTAVGAGALLSNGTGVNNTANGVLALFSNDVGQANTAIGSGALLSNTFSDGNTAIGFHALFGNTANENTATGDRALESNTTGNLNTANGGSGPLLHNTTGSGNTAIGAEALQSNTTGVNNTAVGGDALLNNATGGFNIAIGFSAGINLTTGDNNIDIGFDVAGVAGESDTIRIGNQNIDATYIHGISGATASGGAAVFINSDGKLGTMTSSARFKDEIKAIGNDSEALLALRPVRFRYRKDIDPQGIVQFGLVAEEVEKISPDLVLHDRKGQPYAVRYEQVNAMLLNEFLKEHKKVERLQATVAAQQKAFQSNLANHQKQIEVLAASLHKINARLETSRSAPELTSDTR
jgi:Chaperone of endosialidase